MRGKSTKILWIREAIPWMGQYSGYERLFKILDQRGMNQHQTVYRDSNQHLSSGVDKLLRRAVKQMKRPPFYNKYSLKAEFQAVFSSIVHRSNIVHVTYIENNLGILGQFGSLIPARIIGTAHQPVSWWLENRVDPKLLSSLDILIVLSEKERLFFETLLPGRVHLIPHGIDTEFFHPLNKNHRQGGRGNKRRCVFAGIWLRNFEALVDVINLVNAEAPDIVFDLIIPQRCRQQAVFQRIKQPKQLKRHSDLTDEQLRDVYWNADLLFLPLTDSTANNSLLEATACGLPVVSNTVGGVSEYTSGSFAELLPPDDFRGMAKAILRLLNGENEEKRQSARQFVKTHYTWHRIASQMESLYAAVS